MGGGHGGGGAAPRRVRAAGQLSCCPSHTVLLQVLHRADDMAPGEVAPYRVRLEDGSELTVLTDEGSEIVGANSHGDEEDGEEAGEGCEAQAAPQQQQSAQDADAASERGAQQRDGGSSSQGVLTPS